ncbi:MAG: arsenic efflux protein, partial [Peptostreptococcaceae bacterium]|nr:arsenic efflux protein [Peptostreptococcaceae bacterium]
SHDHDHDDEHSHVHSHSMFSIESLIGVLGVTLSIVYTILSKKYLKNSTHEEVESKIFSFKEMIIHSASETAFVITWIFIGYLIYDIGVMALGGQEVLDSILLVNGVFSIIVGALLGIIPGCGVQVIFISLYSKGVIPFAALVANSISQDGDALFPLIAMDKKSALWATILTTIPAIVIGFIVYIVMH